MVLVDVRFGVDQLADTRPLLLIRTAAPIHLFVFGEFPFVVRTLQPRLLKPRAWPRVALLNEVATELLLFGLGGCTLALRFDRRLLAIEVFGGFAQFLRVEVLRSRASLVQILSKELILGFAERQRMARRKTHRGKHEKKKDRLGCFHRHLIGLTPLGLNRDADWPRVWKLTLGVRRATISRMEFIWDIALFLSKTIIIVAGVGAVLILLVQAILSGRRRQKSGIEVEKLNERYRTFRFQMQSRLLGKKDFKALSKSEKKTAKSEKSAPRATRLFVLDFEGDIRAAATADLREEITAILSIAKSGDEVVVKLESGGGLVTSYGLAASQLARLKSAGVKLTICVDKVAASGGYMMACVADQILAAPFAIVGSIGVIAQVPNFNRVLKKHDIDYREVTAGEFKRTVTVFGEITDTGLQKFKSQIEETHDLFKAFVHQNRPKMDIARVATGEYWYGTQALGLGLVDQIRTSDDYLVSHYETADVFSVKHHGRRRLADRVTESFAQALYRLASKLWTDLDKTKYGA